MDFSGHRLRFAYSTINWGAACDIPQALAEIRSAGWQAVELFGHSLDHLGTPALLAQHLDGIVPATFFAGIEFPSTDQQLVKLRNHIRFASEAGATVFGLVGGNRLRWRPPSESEYRELAGLCEELAVYGVSVGVTVGYHPHVACTVENSDEIAMLMAKTSTLQLCLDASHIALVGEDPLTVIDRWWDRLGYIHLKDWGSGKFRELGQGTIGIAFPEILAELQRRKFGGWIVLEQSQSDVSPLQSARMNAEYLASIGHDIQLPSGVV